MEAERAVAPAPSPAIPVAEFAPPKRPGEAALPRRKANPFGWLPRRIASIRGNPEDEREEPLFSRRNVLGFLGSTGFHLLLLLLLGGLILLGSGEPELVEIETSLGSTLGDEEGLDRVGGFDDDLMAETVEPVELSSAELLAPREPVVQLDASALLSDLERQTDGNGVGGGAEFGVTRFGNGLVEKIQGVEVKVGDPQFTLIWDTQADIDLHILEPGGSHIFWDRRNGEKGGELDVDDVDGFGPENVYWVVDRTNTGDPVMGRGPGGKYQWYVHYYGGHGGIAVPTRWKVRVKHEGKVGLYEGILRRVGERSSIYTLEMPERR